MTVPAFLFHGSGFDNPGRVLKPGISYTKTEVFWDEVESNRFLYATEDRHKATALGLASSFEKKYPLDRFQFRDGVLRFWVPRIDKPKVDWEALPVYLYTIRGRQSDGWVLNDNRHNTMTDEWKTDQDVRNIVSIEKINIKKWLERASLKVIIE